MEARDATGRKVSLLNDDSARDNTTKEHQLKNPHIGFSLTRPPLAPHYSLTRSGSSSPNTPELLRSDSYDSQMSNDAFSPLTPSVDFSFARGYYHEKGNDGHAMKRPALQDSSRSTSYDDEHSATSSLPERPAKRYPCRFRDSHGCEKTFTTSGHASRHSKIHTAEKAVQCTYPGCQKKFTRADNMKQHLETHYKDKSRSSSQRKISLADVRRNSASGRSRSSTSSHDHVAGARSDVETLTQYPLPTPPLAPGGGWDVRLPLHGRPSIHRSPNSGLDALAMAVACQEGGN